MVVAVIQQQTGHLFHSWIPFVFVDLIDKFFVGDTFCRHHVYFCRLGIFFRQGLEIGGDVTDAGDVGM